MPPDDIDVGTDPITRWDDGPDAEPGRHEWDDDAVGGVNAALAAGRPLLVRGEPGLGKSQLARAAAAALERAYLPFVVDSRTEHRDLLWRFDAVRRLAAAQLVRHGGDESTGMAALAEENFVEPGPLWWGLNWQTARDARVKAAGGTDPLTLGRNGEYKENGWVLLIDEIDKAESDVPNGLLEVLGSRQFTPPGRSSPVVRGGPAPLVVVTTNEDRSLPAAFLRRCLVLNLELPERDDDLTDLLVRRGTAHFGERAGEPVLRLAAEQLCRDRRQARERDWRPLPGQAEYLDMIRVLVTRHPNDAPAQETLLRSASKYLFRKHAGR